MPQFVMLTRVSEQSLHQPKSFETLERHAVEQVAKACPRVKWLADFAVLGPYDYLDVFEAPDLETAMRVSALVRSYGHAHTEVWPAMRWAEFNKIVHALPAAPEKPAARQGPQEPPAREHLGAASRAQLGRDEEARAPRPRDEDASIEDPLGDWPEGSR